MSCTTQFVTFSLHYTAICIAILLACLIALLAYLVSHILSFSSRLFRFLDSILLTSGLLDIPSLTVLYTVLRTVQSTRTLTVTGQQVHGLAEASEELAYSTVLDIYSMYEQTQKVRSLRQVAAFDNVQAVKVESPKHIHSANPVSDSDQSPTARLLTPTFQTKYPFGDEHEIESPSEMVPSSCEFYKQICPQNGFPFSESARLKNLICMYVEPIDCPIAKSINWARQPNSRGLGCTRKGSSVAANQLDLQNITEVIQTNEDLLETYESPEEPENSDENCLNSECLYTIPIFASPCDIISPSPLLSPSCESDLGSPVSLCSPRFL